MNVLARKDYAGSNIASLTNVQFWDIQQTFHLLNLSKLSSITLVSAVSISRGAPITSDHTLLYNISGTLPLLRPSYEICAQGIACSYYGVHTSPTSLILKPCSRHCTFWTSYLAEFELGSDLIAN